MHVGQQLLAPTMRREPWGDHAGSRAPDARRAFAMEGHAPKRRLRRRAVSGPFRVELEASRVDSDPRPLVLAAASDSTAGQALDVLGEALGLTNAAGAVQARSLISGRWVERAARLSDIGLLRGERLSLVVGL